MTQIDDILKQWNTARPDLDVAPMALIGRMKRVTQTLSREMEKTFAAHGLNAASFDVLATLRRSGPPYRLSPGDLLATMMVTSGTMTNRIDQLCKLDLVERIHNPKDGRSVIIALTEKGFGVIDAAVTAHVKTQTRLVTGLSGDDRAILNALLEKFMESLD